MARNLCNEQIYFEINNDKLELIVEQLVQIKFGALVSDVRVVIGENLLSISYIGDKRLENEIIDFVKSFQK